MGAPPLFMGFCQVKSIWSTPQSANSTFCGGPGGPQEFLALMGLSDSKGSDSPSSLIAVTLNLKNFVKPFVLSLPSIFQPFVSTKGPNLKGSKNFSYLNLYSSPSCKSVTGYRRGGSGLHIPIFFHFFVLGQSISTLYS